VEALGVDFSTTVIARDSAAPPAKKKVEFPTELQATEAYSAVLADRAAAWKRESDLLEGQAIPGKGFDFPGDLGTLDDSGVVQETPPLDISEEDRNILEAALYNSDAEEYEEEPAKKVPPPVMARKSSKSLL